MKALIIATSRDVIESICLSFQPRWPQATLYCVADRGDGIDAVEAEWMDIAILDLDLPSIGGFDVLEQICLFSDAPLIALTSSNEDMEKARALESRPAAASPSL
jgi:DNA-binding response OmpR family regulator